MLGRTGGGGTAVWLSLAVIFTVGLAILLALFDSPPPLNPLDGTQIAEGQATEPPFWVAQTPQIMTATPNTAVTLPPTIVSTPPDSSFSLVTPENCGQIPAGWQAYMVQASDSLTSLGVARGITVAEIMRVNCLTVPVIYPNTILYLPIQAPTRVPCGPPSWWTRYLVQSGDTLFSLARRYGTTVYQIMNANCMVGPQLTAGRYIYLPPRPCCPPPLPRYHQPKLCRLHRHRHRRPLLPLPHLNRLPPPRPIPPSRRR
jgi:LysM repeat protein